MHNSDNSRKAGSGEGAKLDHGRLMDFRNLVAVAKDGSDMRETAELAFNKRGDQGEIPNNGQMKR